MDRGTTPTPEGGKGAESTHIPTYTPPWEGGYKLGVSG